MGKKVATNKMFDKFELMDSKDIVELVRQYKETRDELLLNKILEQQYKLVMKMARKYYKSGEITYEFDDLIQEGMIDLNNAINHYDESKDILFYSFAKTCIERKMISTIISTRRQKHRILNSSISFESFEDE